MKVSVSILLMIASCLVIWRSAGGFELASDYLGRKLTHGIKGATINAIASSMPEFLSTFFFLFYLGDENGFSGGLGITAGSSIFNLLVIPAAVILVTALRNPGQTIELTLKVLRRDGIVLILTIVVLVLVIDQQVLRPWHGLVLVLGYLAYLGYMFLAMKNRGSGEENYVHRKKPSRAPLLIRILTLRLECLIVGNRELNRKNAWSLLLVSTLVMSLGTWMLVLGTKMMSDILQMPILFVAVVLSAAASSVPDTFISIKDAVKGNYDDAISNALGSNIFDISFALGLPLLVYTLIFGEIQMASEIREPSAVLWTFLLVITVVGVIIFNAGRKLSMHKGIIFLIIYLLFVFFVFGYAFHMELMDRLSEHLLSFIDRIEEIF